MLTALKGRSAALKMHVSERKRWRTCPRGWSGRTEEVYHLATAPVLLSVLI